MNFELKKDIQIISQNLETLKDVYKVKKIGIFGSRAKGLSTKKSDIDVIVELDKPIGFFLFIELEEFLSKLLRKKVDLVTKNALKPIIKNLILKETIYV